MNQRLSILIFFLITSFFSHAQDFTIKSYETKHGLPTNMIKRVTKDDHGFLWIGTDAGLVKFDGEKSTTYTKELPSQYVKHVTKLHDGRIAVVTDMGISTVTPHIDHPKFELLVQGASELSDSTIRYPKRIFEDPLNQLWIGESEHISRINEDGTFTRFKLDPKYFNNSFTHSYEFINDGYGNLWISSVAGYLFYFDFKKEELVEVPLPDHVGYIMDLFLFGRNALWLSTTEGIYQIVFKPNKQIASYQFVTDLKDVVTIKRDRRGDIYVGTRIDGLWKLRVNARLQILDKEKVEGTISSSVINLFVDEVNNIWHSSDEGLGLYIPKQFSLKSREKGEKFVQALTENEDHRFFGVQGGLVEFHHDGSNGLEETTHLIYIPNVGTALASQKNVIWVGNNEGKLFKYHLFNKSFEEVDFKSEKRLINDLKFDIQNNLWIAMDYEGGLLMMDQSQQFSTIDSLETIPTALKSGFDNEIYIGGRGKNYLYKYDISKGELTNLSLEIPINAIQNFSVNDITINNRREVFLSTTEGLWVYKNNQMELISLGHKIDKMQMYSMAINDNDELWVSTQMGLFKRNEKGDILWYTENSGVESSTFTKHGLIIDYRDRIWLGSSKGVFFSNKVSHPRKSPTPVIKSLKINNETINPLKGQEEIALAYNEVLQIQYKSLIYPSEGNYYQHAIQQKGDEGEPKWSTFNKNEEMLIPPLSTGHYTLSIRAVAPNGYTISAPLEVNIFVNKPWYFQWWNILGFIITAFLLVYVTAKLILWRQKKEKIKLESIIQDRTHELQESQNELLAQNEELYQQSEEIKSQRDDISQKNEELSHKNKLITDSLRYAKDVQESVLPSEELMADHFADHYVYFKPKDIVSGDFYWMKVKEDVTYIALADCTGHGVPGAFMSMIGSTLLNDSISRSNASPSTILEHIDQGLKKTLHQKEGKQSDGMDVAVCMIKKEGDYNRLVFAGAKMPFFYINEKQELIRVNGSKRSIGIDARHKKVDFEEHEFEFPGNTSIYLSSDGFRDQSNTDKKRIGIEKFMEIIELNALNHMRQQKQDLAYFFEQFKGEEEQRDDVSVIGLKLK